MDREVGGSNLRAHVCAATGLISGFPKWGPAAALALAGPGGMLANAAVITLQLAVAIQYAWPGLERSLTPSLCLRLYVILCSATMNSAKLAIWRSDLV